jgi:hypothetical protein
LFNVVIWIYKIEPTHPSLRLRTRWLALAAVMLASCESRCPTGWWRDQALDQCVTLVDGAVSDAGAAPIQAAESAQDAQIERADAEQPQVVETGMPESEAGVLDAAPRDAGADMDSDRPPGDADSAAVDVDADSAAVDVDADSAAVDADSPAADADGGPDLDAVLPSDATPDTTEAALPEPDADVDSAASDATCSAEELTKWRSFEVSDAMVDAAQTCGGSLSTCEAPGCAIASCIREQAAIVECTDCIDVEARCVATHCASDCGSAGDPYRCLGCACFSSCFVTRGSCGMGPTDICAFCSQGTCGTWWVADAGTWHAPQEIQTANRGALQPVAFSRARNKVETLFINDDGTLGYTHNVGPDALGGPISSVPGPSASLLQPGSLAVAVWRTDAVYVIARGSEGRLWLLMRHGEQWGEWQNTLGISGLRSDDRLSIVARGANLRDAAFASSAGTIQHVHWDAAGQASLKSLGAPSGVTLRSPMIVARDIASLELVAWGNDRRIYHKALRAGEWSDWVDPGGSDPDADADAAPQIASSLPTSVDIFWYKVQPVGKREPIRRMSWKEGVWSRPQNVSPEGRDAEWITDMPSARSVVFDRVDLMGRFRQDSALVYLTFDRSGWGWIPNLSSGAIVSYPVALVSWGPGHLAGVYGAGLGKLGAVTYVR